MLYVFLRRSENALKSRELYPQMLSYFLLAVCQGTTPRIFLMYLDNKRYILQRCQEGEVNDCSLIFYSEICDSIHSCGKLNFHCFCHRDF